MARRRFAKLLEAVVRFDFSFKSDSCGQTHPYGISTLIHWNWKFCGGQANIEQDGSCNVFLRHQQVAPADLVKPCWARENRWKRATNHPLKVCGSWPKSVVFEPNTIEKMWSVFALKTYKFETGRRWELLLASVQIGITGQGYGLCRVAQTVVSWLAANEDQKNLWGPWDLEGIRTFVAKWDMSRIRAFWNCFDSDKCDLTQTLLRHLVKKMVTGASGPQ